jgi:hypothetical protein
MRSEEARVVEDCMQDFSSSTMKSAWAISHLLEYDGRQKSGFRVRTPAVGCCRQARTSTVRVTS